MTTIKLRPRDILNIKTRLKEYEQAEDKEMFRDQIGKWYTFRRKFMRDHFGEESLETDYIYEVIKSVAKKLNIDLKKY